MTFYAENNGTTSDDTVVYPDVAYQGGTYNPGDDYGVLPDVAYQGDTNNPNNVSSNSGVSPADASRIPADASGWSDTLKKLFTNKDGSFNLQGAGGIAGAILGGLDLFSPNKNPTGYQGGIPNLVATRNMITAPPSDRRPGAGGINYGGDVTYTRAPAGQDPWVNLRGDSAFIAPVAGQANIPKGTGGNDPQSMANKIGYTLPMGWGSFSPQEKIAWFNSNNVSVDQLRAAGVPQSDIDYMLANGYGSAANKPATTPTATTGLPTLPADLSSYTAQQKADLYNSLLGQKFTDAQIRRAAGPQSDEDWSYLQNLAKKPAAQTTVQGQTPPPPAPPTIPDQSAGLMSALSQGMTEDQYIGNIKSFLQNNATASDADIYDQMQQYGIGASDVARALGVDNSVIQDKLKALGVTNYAMGGMAKGRYLQGETDGMADEIPAQIGRDQPAALSHGEFVVPADVVSHLGNGNSDAGAKKLYQMMDKIRMARTGTKKQGKEINPDKFTPGGLANSRYAQGGKVKGFAPGGSTGTTPTNIGAAANAGVQGSESTLSNWAGPYTTNYLAQGQALANMPYQAYMGPLTAGPSALQNKVSQGLEGLNFPGTLGQSFTSAGAPTAGADGQPVGGGGIASSYMNPYLQNVLNPQMDELRRQSQINLQPGLAKLTAAGGYGGGRQAIMESEANRNLLQEQNKTVGQGYANAFDKAMQQFNTEQGQAKDLVGLMASQGAVNRGIESEGVAADKAQFEEARANPFKMVQFQQSLMNGLPINATDYNLMEPSTLQKAMAGAGGVAGMFPNTTNLTMDDVTTALKKLGIG